MHQQPPHAPLCFSTSRAKSSNVDSSRGFTSKAGTVRSLREDDSKTDEAMKSCGRDPSG